MAKPKRLSRRQASARPRGTLRSDVPASTLSTTSGLPEAIVWGLLLARWLIPTEGTAGGDTLWLTSLTLAVAAGFCWVMSRVSFEPVRFEKLDVAVWFLCGAHVLSAVSVVLTDGNKRAATNMLWEWLAVAVLFSLLRQTITPRSRTGFLRTILIVTTALACYGIWQPAFWYPANLQQYESLREELDAVESDSGASPVERANRLRELHGEFVARGIPLSGPQQKLFEGRLRDSKEPLGFFALANTFASFMAVTMVLLAGVLLGCLFPSAGDGDSAPDRGSRRNLVVAVFCAFLLVAYCLLLTKSRSAWAGSAVGMATLIGLLLIRLSSNTAVKRLLTILCVGLVVFSVLTGVAIATDALDVEVVSEALMSLQYRMEYWTATWDVILDHPLLGTGPGNFREHYLKYKLPASSEEISDPHQFVLDVMANAGVVGLIGLFLIFAVLFRLAWKLRNSHQQDVATGSREGDSSDLQSARASRGAIAFTGAVTLAIEWLFSGLISWHILSITLLAVGLDCLLAIISKRSTSSKTPRCSRLIIPSMAIVAALVTMFVHLSAAGGIAMPAVAGLVFALAAVLSTDSASALPPAGEESSVAGIETSSSSSRAESGDASNNGSWLGAALFAGLAAVGCTTTAFVPVTHSKSVIQIGDYEAVNGQSAQRAFSHYKEAAKADPLSPEPHVRMGQYYLRQWQQTREIELFEKSIESAEKALSLSPYSPQIAHDIGSAWLIRAAETSPRDEVAITSAIEEMQNALAMYPTQPVWTAEAAQAYALAGESDKASALAQRALELDEINRNAGHVDRYLPEPLKSRVSQFAGSE